MEILRDGKSVQPKVSEEARGRQTSQSLSGVGVVGAMLGDMVGSVYEFDNVDVYDYPWFSPRACYTDDSILTLAVYEAALTDQDFEKELIKWTSRYPNPMGAYGSGFLCWIHSRDKKPYNSCGNGSAMRTSGCAGANSLEEVLKLARASALVTHNHPEGVKAAECTAHLIYLAQLGQSVDELLRVASKVYDYDVDGSIEGLRAEELFRATCQETMPAVFACLREAKSYEEAIRNSVYIGGDSDTIACIVGSIAEPLWGIEERLLEPYKRLFPEVIPAYLLDTINCIVLRGGQRVRLPFKSLFV